MKYKYRVDHVGVRGEFSTYERALRRARELRTKLNLPFDVLEIDEDGNATPIAHVAPKRAPKIINEPRTNYARSL